MNKELPGSLDPDDFFFPLPWVVSEPSDSHTRSRQRSTPSESEVPDATPEGKEKVKAVKLTGRLVYAPRFDARQDRLRVNFVLAEHRDDGATVYHRVYALRDHARRLQAKQLKKGDLVEVAGAWQRHVVKGKDGQMHEVPVLYCYGATIRGGASGSQRRV